MCVCNAEEEATVTRGFYIYVNTRLFQKKRSLREIAQILGWKSSPKARITFRLLRGFGFVSLCEKNRFFVDAVFFLAFVSTRSTIRGSTGLFQKSSKLEMKNWKFERAPLHMLDGFGIHPHGVNHSLTTAIPDSM